MRKCTVHTVHYYTPEVRAIHCMAKGAYSKLALSRSDGTIEIWCMQGTPYMQGVLYASSVESLAWCKERLFSAGLHGTVLEFNVLELSVKYTIPIVGGPVWCIAVDCTNTMLAVGTEEGYVNILNLSGDDAPQPLKLLDKQEGRVLCLAWHPDGKQIITGSTDSLRLWDVRTGRGTRRMTVARATRKEETTVWFVAVTKEGLGVSGDSRGVVSFWNLETGVQSQAITTHSAPVLAIALKEDGSKIFCAGADPVVAVLDYDRNAKRWIRTVDRRLHEHDVRALACFGQRLASGGVDGYLAVSQFPPRILNKYPPLQHDAVSLSKARLLLLRHTRHVEVWSLGATQHGPECDPGRAPASSGSKHLLNLQSQHAEHMSCAAISYDGAHIAYATPTATRLVALSASEESVSISGSWAVPGVGGALALAFCPVKQRLAAASRAGQVLVFELGSEPQLVALIEARADKHLTGTLRLLSFSPDGRHLAASDLGGGVAAFFTRSWKVAFAMKKNKVATALCFRKDALMAVFADHKICEWTLYDSRFTPFAKACANVVSGLSGSSVVTRAAWDQTRSDRLLLVDDASLYGLSPPAPSSDEPEAAKKSRGDGKSLENRVAVIAKYKHVAFADWLSPNELVVVETTPTSLQQSLPPVFKKGRFGTK